MATLSAPDPNVCAVTGKRRYDTVGEAQTHMDSLVERGRHAPERGRLNVFTCEHCNGWHVGHFTRHERDGLRRRPGGRKR